MIWNTLLNTIVSFIVIYISLYFFFILSQCFSITTWNPATGPRHATVQLPRFTSWWPPAAGPCSTNRSPKSCVCAPSARPTPCVCLGCLGCEGWDGLVNVGYMCFFFMGETYGKTNCFFLVHTSCNRNYGGMIWIWKQWRWGCKNHGSRWLTNEIRLILSHLFFPVFWALEPIRTIARSSNYLPLLSTTLIGEPCLLMQKLLSSF